MSSISSAGGSTRVGKSMTVVMSANQTGIPSDTAPGVNFDTVYLGSDDGTLGWDPSNFWFLPIAGWYLVTTSVKIVGAGGDTVVDSYAIIQKGLTGDSYIGSTITTVAVAANDATSIAVQPVYLDGSTPVYIRSHVQQSGASNGNISASGSYFSITALRSIL